MDEFGVITQILALPLQTAEEEEWGYEELRGWVEREGIWGGKGKGEGEWVWVGGGKGGGEGRKGKGDRKGRARGKGKEKGKGWWFPGFVGEWVFFYFLILIFGLWFVLFLEMRGGVEEGFGERMDVGVKR